MIRKERKDERISFSLFALFAVLSGFVRRKWPMLRLELIRRAWRSFLRRAIRGRERRWGPCRQEMGPSFTAYIFTPILECPVSAAYSVRATATTEPIGERSWLIRHHRARRPNPPCCSTGTPSRR